MTRYQLRERYGLSDDECAPDDGSRECEVCGERTYRWKWEEVLRETWCEDCWGKDFDFLVDRIGLDCRGTGKERRAR